MNKKFLEDLQARLEEVQSQGLYKHEWEIASPQGARVTLATGTEMINLCSNNYLGLSDHPDVVKAAHEGLEKYGFGLSSVRFICGTQTIHRQLEQKLSQFLGTEETILYGSCFDANGGLFETLFTDEDAIFSDELNHASIIDGIRLCKAERFRYRHSDMNDLRRQLKDVEARFKVIATDGVFSMDGDVAKLADICDLADQNQALVMVDDCHGVGVFGRGTHEKCGVLGRVDIITGTLGKALGGATGGYTSGRKEIIDLLRQRSRPYLFSNSVAPSVITASLKVLDLISEPELRRRLKENSDYFRKNLTTLGFDLIPGDHPIIPAMLGDAKLAQEFSRKMLDHGVYVVGFFYPVVPQGKARIRTQVSAAHSREDLDKALAAFEAVGRELEVTA